jgi:hypothetical protein
MLPQIRIDDVEAESTQTYATYGMGTRIFSTQLADWLECNIANVRSGENDHGSPDWTMNPARTFKTANVINAKPVYFQSGKCGVQRYPTRQLACPS